MNWLLLSLLAAQPASPLEPAPRTNAAWLSLAPVVVGLALREGQLAAGVQVALTPEVGLAFEAATHFGGPYFYECATEAHGIWLTAGAVIRPLSGGARAGGFFVQPKVVFHWGYAQGLSNSELVDPQCSREPYPNGGEFDVGVGASIGWDWVVVEHLYLGTALGASIGLGRTRAALTRVANLGAVELIWQFDFSLLRVGFAW